MNRTDVEETRRRLSRSRPTAPAEDVYEYGCFPFVALGGTKNVVDFLNKYAAEGWEYVHGLPYPLDAYSEAAVNNGTPRPLLFRRARRPGEQFDHKTSRALSLPQFHVRAPTVGAPEGWAIFQESRLVGCRMTEHDARLIAELLNGSRVITMLTHDEQDKQIDRLTQSVVEAEARRNVAEQRCQRLEERLERIGTIATSGES